MNLKYLATLLSQTCQSDDEILGASIDSRRVSPGDLFIALVGEHYDAHDFVQDAQKQGACAAVVSRRVAGVTIPQFLVDDTEKALVQIATAQRALINCPTIALTGSNGKTTVKEMIAAILPAPSHATKGNYNNHIGAPLTMLNLKKEHRYAVFELGASHIGEIANTVAIVKPQVTLINNIAPAHVEGFGSIDGVARAKGEIHQGLISGGTAVVNDDDSYARYWDDILADKQVLHFSLKEPKDVYAKDLRFDTLDRGHFSLILPKGQAEIELQVPGAHNVRNALAAAACCFALGISIADIQRGLNQFSGVKGRLMILQGKNQATIIDDTYNANLRSVIAGLEVLAKRPGKKIFVFGDMGELGEWAKQHHQEVGLTAHTLGINEVLTCGDLSQLTSEAFGTKGTHFSSQDDLVNNLVGKMDKNTVVLVKGSRSSAMENIVQKLLN